MKMQNRNKQKGVTLIELLLGLVVILVVIGVGIVIYNQVTSNAGSYQTTSSVMNLNAAVKSLHPRPDYFGLTNNVLINSGKAPSNLVVGGNLVGQWGGAITLTPRTFDAAGLTACAAAPCNAFEISYVNVPQDACTTLVLGMERSFDFISVGGTAVKNRLGAAAHQQPTPAAITTACQAAGASATLLFGNT